VLSTDRGTAASSWDRSALGMRKTAHSRASATKMTLENMGER
jgi:hypothetical protein